jgi:GTP-binding protein Era
MVFNVGLISAERRTEVRIFPSQLSDIKPAIAAGFRFLGDKTGTNDILLAARNEEKRNRNENYFLISYYSFLISYFMKVGFVNIFGRPNAGKSTLLNLLMGEKLAIVSPKVQTTRHRIKGILTEKEYQIVFSDTPGIIEPKYKLHEKMMQAVKNSLEDADVALLMLDINDDWQQVDEIFSSLKLKVPSVVIINKADVANKKKLEEAQLFFTGKEYNKKLVVISALNPSYKNELLNAILEFLPEGEPFYEGEEISDLSEKFFVAEIVREKIFGLFEEEIPYQATVVVQEFKQKSSLIKIRAEIVVQRESQKAIIIGEGGKMIKKIGTMAREDIEKFLQQKVFLELFVKVRDRWRDNEIFLKEFGY